MQNTKLKLDMECRPAVNPGLVLRIEDDDCALLFDPDNGRVQMLNRSAVDVWQLLDGKRTLQDVVECLRESYDDLDDTVPEQILDLVERLATLGAVGIWEED